MKSLLKDCLFTKAANAAAAGTTDVDTTVFDMSGYDAILFIANVGDVTSGSVLELQVFGNTASSTSSPTPVELTADSATITAGASDADNTIFIVDVLKPSYRYVFARLVIDTQNAVTNGIYAIQYHARSVPITQGATVIRSALLGPLA